MSNDIVIMGGARTAIGTFGANHPGQHRGPRSDGAGGR